MPGAALSSIDLIRKLVSFDTTSRDSNLHLIDFVRNYLADHGIDSELVYGDDRRKANLYATLGPQDIPGVMLSGHTDVVPVDGQKWHTDPFAVREADGLLYGRGTADMKSFIAVALAMVPDFLAAELKTPIHLALSFDEEVGCLGVRRLIEELATKPLRPKLCIVGEPTLMKPVVAHKGKKSWRCHVHGVECHSALAHIGVNAVEAAAEAVAYLKGMARRQRDDGPYDPLFTPPYTTVHTGVIRGGTALNIVPKDCSFDFEFRHLPKVDPDALMAELQRHIATAILPEMQAVDPATGFAFEPLTHIPGLAAAPDGEPARTVMALSGANSVGVVSFGTEAGLFQESGIPTIICGPGSIEQAHKPDEFIALEQVAQCEAFLHRLKERVCA